MPARRSPLRLELLPQSDEVRDVGRRRQCHRHRHVATVTQPLGDRFAAWREQIITGGTCSNTRLCRGGANVGFAYSTAGAGARERSPVDAQLAGDSASARRSDRCRRTTRIAKTTRVAVSIAIVCCTRSWCGHSFVRCTGAEFPCHTSRCGPTRRRETRLRRLFNRSCRLHTLRRVATVRRTAGR